MARRKKPVPAAGVKTTAAGLWSYSSGKKPRIISVAERAPGNFALRARWTVPETGERPKVKLDFTVRDASGEIDPTLVDRAKVLIDDMAARFRLGGDPLGRDDAAPSNAVSSPSAEESVERKRLQLTIEEGYDLALDPNTGKYASSETRHFDQVAKRADRLLGRNGHVAIIDPTLRWSAVRPSNVRGIWRTIADRYKESDGKRYGLAAAEDFVADFYAIAKWLKKEEAIPSTAVARIDEWHKELRLEWPQRAGEPVKEKPSRPRHSAAEYRKLLAALSDPRCDRRLRFLLELAAELRVGQARLATRRCLRLPGDPHLEEALPDGSIGECRVRGNERKPGETLHLTPEQRAVTDEALATYLANYERAWRAGEIQDYQLFPGGKMSSRPDGTVWARRVRPSVKPISRDGLRQLFRQLEEIAEVEHVEGRGWYGLRRIATDLTHEATTDDRVRERMGGWTAGSDVPATIYQDRETIEIRQTTADVRRVIRGVVPAAPTPAASSDPLIDALLASLSDEQRRMLTARLHDSNGPANVRDNGDATAPERPQTANPSGAVGSEGIASDSNTTT
jgi:hypothetical protein